MFRIAASGGDAVRVTKGDAVEMWPWFLPDGNHFLFCSGIAGKTGIYVGSLSFGERRLLIPMAEITPSRAAYASGYVIYNRVGALYAQKFDEKKLEVTGDPQKPEDEIDYNAPGRAAFSVSSGGTLVYHEAGLPVVSQLLFADRTGREIATVGPIAGYSDFRISPDQRRVAFMSWDNEAATWLLDVERAALTRTSFERWGGFPVWLPDGRRVERPATRRASGATAPLTPSAPRRAARDRNAAR